MCRLPRHIVLKCLNTVNTIGMYRHTRTPLSTHTGSRCMVEVEKDSFQYKQRALQKTIPAIGYHCVLRVCTQNTARKPKQFTPSPLYHCNINITYITLSIYNIGLRTLSSLGGANKLLQSEKIIMHSSFYCTINKMASTSIL